MRERLSTKPRGVLQLDAPPPEFDHARYAPATALVDFVEHYWVVQWGLKGGEPRVVETLPHPSVHLVTDQRGVRLLGIATGKFTRVLEDTGRVVGVKFRPGAFYPFFRRSVALLTGSSMRLGDAFGADGEALELLLRSASDAHEVIEHAESFLLARLPPPDEHVRTIGRIVSDIITDRSITSVDELLRRRGHTKRGLQRLFNRYVGVSPKWMIQRYRLHEAADRLDKGGVSLTQLALELGYHDQAHFIKDFSAIVGMSPGAYAAAVRAR